MGRKEKTTFPIVTNLLSRFSPIPFYPTNPYSTHPLETCPIPFLDQDVVKTVFVLKGRGRKKHHTQRNKSTHRYVTLSTHQYSNLSFNYLPISPHPHPQHPNSSIKLLFPLPTIFVIKNTHSLSPFSTLCDWSLWDQHPPSRLRFLTQAWWGLFRTQTVVKQQNPTNSTKNNQLGPQQTPNQNNHWPIYPNTPARISKHQPSSFGLMKM